MHYGGTVAPLIVHDTVVAGVAGGDRGIRGLLAAFAADTGAVVWRTWTIPRRGEPGSDTWKGPEPVTGGGATWLTGSYDASSDTLYWATGNPCPNSNDVDRPRRQSLHQLRARAERQDRRVEVALPVHTS